VADPGAGEARVGVVGVLPRVEALRLAGGLGGGAAHGQQRPPVAAAAGGHAGQGPGAGTSGEAEQDGFGLVIEGVAKEEGCGACFCCGGAEGFVPGGAGGCFGAALAGYFYGDLEYRV